MARPIAQRVTRILLTFAGIAALYAGSYALNSHCGGYWLKPLPGGKYRWASGPSFTSAIHWMPRYGWYGQSEFGDLIGFVYEPLIQLDRSWWHPRRDLFDNDFDEWIRTVPLDQIHPVFRDEVILRRSRRQERASDDAPVR